MSALHHLPVRLAAMAVVAAGAMGLASCASATFAAGPGTHGATASPAGPSSTASSPSSPAGSQAGTPDTTPQPSSAAPSTPAATTPTTSPTATDLSITFAHSLQGRTLSFRYTDTGHQHEWIDPTNEVYASHESAGHRIDFGDGQQTGSDGGALKCSTLGSVPFTTAMPPGKHTYAKAGTYTVTVSASYCGAASDPNASGPSNHVTRQYTVVVH